MADTPKPPAPPIPYFAAGAHDDALEEELPGMLFEMLEFMGERPPRVSGRSRRKLARRTGRVLDRVRPHLIGIEALRGNIPENHARYALMEALIREVVFPPIPRTRDACVVLLDRMKRAAAPPPGSAARLPAYKQARAALVHLAERLAPDLDEGSDAHRLMVDWSVSSDARSTVQLIRQLGAHSRGWRSAVPRRFTDRAISQLVAEYRYCSNLFEQRLRLLVAVHKAATGRGRPWADWRRESLNNLLAAADVLPPLDRITPFINRHVRNAVDHKYPIVSWKDRSVTFDDLGRTVTWSFSDFFTNTRDMTAATLALASFESLVQCRRFEAMLHDLWAMCAAERQPPPAASAKAG